MRTIILSSLLPGRSVYLSASERRPNKSSHQSAAFCVGRNMGGLSLIEAFLRIQSVKPSQIGVDLNPHTLKIASVYLCGKYVYFPFSSNWPRPKSWKNV